MKDRFKIMSFGLQIGMKRLQVMRDDCNTAFGPSRIEAGFYEAPLERVG